MPESNVAVELRNRENEPLLPVEKKLIGWSLGIGLGLLLLLLIATHVFPAA
jgi:hypothetical protein